MSNSTPHDIIVWFFLVVFCISSVLLGWLLWPFFSVIILAIVVTGVFTPIYQLIKQKLPPVFASLSTCIIIFFVLFIPISFFVGILANEAYDLYFTARDAVQNQPIKELFENSKVLDQINILLANINIKITGDELNSAISEIGRVVGLFLYEQARSITANVFKFIVSFFFMLLIIFYLLIDSSRLASFVVSLSPLPNDQDQKLIQKFKDIAGAILIGNGLGGVIQGTLGGILFALFGLQSPFLWGAVMALLAFLPIVGVGVVFIPAALYLLLKGRIAAGIFFIFFYVILSGCVEYLFKPKLVGKRVQMPALLVFLAIIGGLKLFGILGIIYGPIIVTAFLTLAEIYESNYRKFVEPMNE